MKKEVLDKLSEMEQSFQAKFINPEFIEELGKYNIEKKENETKAPNLLDMINEYKTKMIEGMKTYEDTGIGLGELSEISYKYIKDLDQYSKRISSDDANQQHREFVEKLKKNIRDVANAIPAVLVAEINESEFSISLPQQSKSEAEKTEAEKLEDERIFKQNSNEAKDKNDMYRANQKEMHESAKSLSDSQKDNDSLEKIREKSSYGTNFSRIRREKQGAELQEMCNKFFDSDSDFWKKIDDIGKAFVKRDENGEIVREQGLPTYTEDNIYTRTHSIMEKYRFTIIGITSKIRNLNKKDIWGYEVMEQLDEMLDELDAALIFKGSDDKFFRDLYNAAVVSHERINEFFNGDLFIPAENEEFLDGKRIHRISNVKYVDKDGKRVAEAVRQPSTQIYTDTSRKTAYNKSLAISMREYETPIFNGGDPKPEDIKQGFLGNCYFVAALAAVAAKNPDKIREMIQDHGDGSVTVRFFTDDQEPVYVTVDRATPYNDKFEYLNDGGCEWAGIITKAFVLSGLHCGKLAEAEKGTYKGAYKDIEGGFPSQAVCMILGTPYQVESEYVQEHYMGYTPKSLKESDAEKIFEIISNAEKSDSIMTCSTRSKFWSKWRNVDTVGLPDTHAYTIMGTEIDSSTNKKYVRVRNPHAAKIRSYDVNGKPIEINENNLDTVHAKLGESLIEIHDFCVSFDFFNVNTYNYTPQQKLEYEKIDNYLNLYEDTVIKLCEDIENTDSWMLRFSNKNSKQFTEFKKAATRAKELMLQSTNLDKLKAGMNDLFSKAEAYHDYCEKSASKQQGLNSRAASRYLNADIVLEIKKVYEQNELKDSLEDRVMIDLDDLTTSVMAAEGSPMKKSACDIKLKEAMEKASGTLPMEFPAAVNYAPENAEQNIIDRKEMLKQISIAIFGDENIHKFMRNADGSRLWYGKRQLGEPASRTKNQQEEIIATLNDEPYTKFQIYWPQDNSMHWLSFNPETLRYSVSQDSIPVPTDEAKLARFNETIAAIKEDYGKAQLPKAEAIKSINIVLADTKNAEKIANKARQLFNEENASTSKSWFDALISNPAIKSTDSPESQFVTSCNDKTAAGRKRIYEFAVGECIKALTESPTKETEQYFNKMKEALPDIISSMKRDGYEAVKADFKELGNLMKNSEKAHDMMEKSFSELPGLKGIPAVDKLCEIVYINSIKQRNGMTDPKEFEEALNAKSISESVSNMRKTMIAIAKAEGSTLLQEMQGKSVDEIGGLLSAKITNAVNNGIKVQQKEAELIENSGPSIS